MKRNVWRYLVLGALVCLLVWGLWYHRPVGVEVLFPGLEIDRVEVTLLRTKAGVTEDWERKLSLSAGEPEFDTLMEEVRALRFRRSPWNPLVRAIPALSRSVPDAVISEEDEVQRMYLTFAGETERYGELFFYVGYWRYLDSAAGNTQFTLSMTDGKAVGQALAGELWELAG